MPNTRPVIDKPETVQYVLDKAARQGIVKVLPYAAITKNELGRELTDFAALKEAGAIGFTDDGVGVQNAQMMKNAMALAKSLDVVAREKSAARKIAVLGEMLELGEHAARLHVEGGRLVAQSGVDVLFAIGGPTARALATAAIDAGMSAAAVTYFPSSAEAAPAIAAAVRAGDLVLVKGSRGIRTDVVVDRIRAECA